MNWREEFVRLLESSQISTDSEIDDYADEHNLSIADVWQCYAEYKENHLIKQSIGTPCEGCKHAIEGSIICLECCRNKADFYEKESNYDRNK